MPLKLTNYNLCSHGCGWKVCLIILNEQCKGDFIQLGKLANQARWGDGRWHLEAGWARLATLTCDVQLVQPVIGQGCIPGAALGFILKACRGGWGGPPVLEDLLEQPAYQAQLLQAVANHVPGEAAGQVQAGGGQCPAQHRQAGLQVCSGSCKIPLANSKKVQRSLASRRPFHSAC